MYVQRNTTLSVKLVQELRDNTDMMAVGAYVLKPSEKAPTFKRLTLSPAEIVGKAPFFRERLTRTEDFALEACALPYVVIPCSFEPGYLRKFQLSAEEGLESKRTSFDLGRSKEIVRFEPAQSWHRSSLRGAWDAQTSGGCINAASWRKNTQYRLEALPGASVTVSCTLLSDDGREVPRGSNNAISMGLYFLSADSQQKKLFKHEERMAFRSPFRKCTDLLYAFSIPEDPSGSDERVVPVHYNVIPCSFKEGTLSPYRLDVHSDKKVALVELSDATHRLQQTGQWEGQSAGGCINNASWISNPHYILVVQKEVRVTVVLSQEQGEGELKHIGLYLTRGDEWGIPIVETEKDILAKSYYEDAPDVSFEVTLKPSRLPYIVTPSTYYPDEELKFTLDVLTAPEHADDVVLIPSVGDTQLFSLPEGENLEQTFEEENSMNSLDSGDDAGYLSSDGSDTETTSDEEFTDEDYETASGDESDGGDSGDAGGSGKVDNDEKVEGKETDRDVTCVEDPDEQGEKEGVKDDAGSKEEATSKGQASMHSPPGPFPPKDGLDSLQGLARDPISTAPNASVEVGVEVSPPKSANTDNAAVPTAAPAEKESGIAEGNPSGPGAPPPPPPPPPSGLAVGKPRKLRKGKSRTKVNAAPGDYLKEISNPKKLRKTSASAKAKSPRQQGAISLFSQIRTGITLKVGDACGVGFELKSNARGTPNT